MTWFSEGIFKLEQKENVKPIAFTVRFTDKDKLDKLDIVADKAGYTRNELLNLVVNKFLDEVSIIQLDNRESEKCKESFTDVDKLLKKHINKEIRIALNKDEIGHEVVFYKLLDYELSFENKFLALTFSTSDSEDFNSIRTMSFKNIYDFSSQYNENGVFRIWIHSNEGNWKFYLK